MQAVDVLSFPVQSGMAVVEQCNEHCSTDDVTECCPNEEVTHVTNRNALIQKHRRQYFCGTEDGVMKGTKSDRYGDNQSEDGPTDRITADSDEPRH